MLGGVGWLHFASAMVTMPSEMRHHGFGRLESLGKLAQFMLRDRSNTERADVLAQLGSFSHGLSRELWSEYQADEGGIPGKISNLLGNLMKFTGVHFIFDNTQAAAKEMAAEQLASHVAGTEYVALEPHLGQMLDKYGIGEGEWRLLRGVQDLPTANGMRYLTPDQAMKVDGGAVAALLRARGEISETTTPYAIEKMVDRFRWDLSDRLTAYYGDLGRSATITPGVRERAFLLGHHQPGTIAGELIRSVAQFKAWPLAALHQIIGREIFSSLGAKDAAFNLGAVIALSLPAGYLQMVGASLASGNPLPNPLDPRVLLEASGRSGALGIVGDLLFGEIMRNPGKAGLDALAGPIGSDVGEALKLYGAWTHGSADWSEVVHLFASHVPFANLIYLKGALDYLLWYHLYEAASPGWWERTNRRLQRQQGQTMQGYVPGRGVPYSPWGIGAAR